MLWRLPWWAAQLATGAKSFADNPLIGSPRLNALGMHAGRVRLEVRENATAVGRERQAEVGTGNRFSGGDATRGGQTVRGTDLAPVRGLGEKR